ncbi:hypothetical protein Glove_19g91 [Diversispora epigaea]|uniref:Uncharacterized protein n=1 Tax=Diversispora epigaea TaxID=1348612 RepID=A0A397JUZ1_9GLOM|nr:hypothetical protein Glove_19g91 [Diversispora epigaea]
MTFSFNELDYNIKSEFLDQIDNNFFLTIKSENYLHEDTQTQEDYLDNYCGHWLTKYEKSRAWLKTAIQLDCHDRCCKIILKYKKTQVIKTANKVIVEKPTKDVTNEHKEVIKSTTTSEIIKKIVSVQMEDGQIELSETICKGLDFSSAETLVPYPKHMPKMKNLRNRNQQNGAQEYLSIKIGDSKAEKEFRRICRIVDATVLTVTVYIYEERNKEQECKHEEKKKQEQKEH